MPWYGSLIIFLTFSTLIGGLVLLLRSAKRLKLTPEQLARIKQRNLEQDAKDAAEQQR